MALAAPPAVRALTADERVPTLGVEEEFFLVRRDGTPAAVAPEVLAATAGDPDVHREWLQCQIETVSGACVRLDTVSAQLSRQRVAVGRVARACDAFLVATGTPPVGLPGRSAVSDEPRYHRLLELFGDVAAGSTSCACHVHVGVPSREVGVEVLNRIRGWLPVLLALSANSPWWAGADTEWQSYRYHVQSRWPTARLPPRVADLAEYDANVLSVVESGDALDVGSIYWLARLSARYPTVEVRVADTGLTVADSVLLAGICRALVATAVAETRTGQPVAQDVPEEQLARSLANAAQHGLRGMLVDPVTGSVTDGALVLHRLMQRLGPALSRAGDRSAVSALLRERVRSGCGATRQRTMRARFADGGLVPALADATTPRARQEGVLPSGLPAQRKETVDRAALDRGER